MGVRRLAAGPAKKAAHRRKIGLGTARGEALGGFHGGGFLGNRRQLCHGLITSIPQPAKSPAFLVAIAAPRDRVMAAI